MCKLYIFMNFWSMHSHLPLHSFVRFWCIYAIWESPEVGGTGGNESRDSVEPLKVTRSLSSLWPIGAPEEGAFIPRWRCHLQSSHCTGKRLYFLPRCIGMSEARIHVDDSGLPMDHYRMVGRGTIYRFSLEGGFAPGWIDCPSSLRRCGSVWMK